MPHPGKRWYHIILNTRGTWLPGDPRGFRTRKHRVHSSGDYKHPPPQGEHAGLHEHTHRISSPPVIINPSLRPIVGQALLHKLQTQTHPVIAICVGSNHAHLLAELPDDRERVKHLAGTWKQAASHRVRTDLPGKLWASGCDPIPIRDKSHHTRTFQYILRHEREGAWVWSFRDGEIKVSNRES